jgi:hypothetical protein
MRRLTLQRLLKVHLSANALKSPLLEVFEVSWHVMSSPICRVAVKLSFPLVAKYRAVDMRQLLLWLAGKQVLAVLPNRSNEKVPRQSGSQRRAGSSLALLSHRQLSSPVLWLPRV